MKSRLLVGALLLLVALSVVACGGPPKVVGTVRLAGAKTVPFPGVNVTLTDAALDSEDPQAVVARVVTDQNGNYTFADVRPGAYHVSLSAVISQLPAGISNCTLGAFAMEGEWLFLSGVTKDGSGVALAVMQDDFTVSSGAARHDATFKCF